MAIVPVHRYPERPKIEDYDLTDPYDVQRYLFLSWEYDLRFCSSIPSYVKMEEERRKKEQRDMNILIFFGVGIWVILGIGVILCKLFF